MNALHCISIKKINITIAQRPREEQFLTNIYETDWTIISEPITVKSIVRGCQLYINKFTF